MNNIFIKELKEEEIKKALALVWEVFLQYEAPDYSQEGIDEFYKSIHDYNYLKNLRIFGAYVNDVLAGVIATRSESTHIALFFVDRKYHRQGIGRHLFQTVIQHNSSGKITVNSSPYAVPVYHKLGFRDTSAEQIVNGLRFTSMEWRP
ncbi:GNAT family N-acetyltransferase [Anaerolentibacter hominis]|uniref:GNAT family N-acetyltransferase n=1 Tax=Anaerolentibacter hominis TaxID=3079009 RepID=UPI0031B883B8